MTAQDNRLSGHVRTMQIIAFAMILGPVLLAAVFLFLAQNDGRQAKEDQPPLITYVALGVAGVGCVLSIVVPNLLAANIVQQAALKSRGEGEGIEHGLMMAYQTTLIIGLALCEGPGLFCLIAYFIERNYLAFIGAGLALLIMLARFPTEDRVRDWVRGYSGRG